LVSHWRNEMGENGSLESKIVRWSRIISLIGLVGLLVLAFITVLEAILRSLFGISIAGVSDISSLVVAIAVCACFPLVFASHGNITVSFFANAVGVRGKAILECFGTLVSMFIFCLLFWQFIVYANELTASNATTWIILWPTAPWWYAATFLIGLCIPVQLILFFSDLKVALTGKEEKENKNQNDKKGAQQ